MSAVHDKLIFKLINDPNYSIEKNGDVLTLVQRNGQVGTNWRKAGFEKKGYLLLTYENTQLRIHRIIWAKFAGYLRCDLVINHKDGDKKNNRFSNLELVTVATNERHAWRTLGKQPNRANARLSWSTVDKIKDDRRNGYTIKKLSEKYDVPRSSVQRICAGESYQDHFKKGF